MTESTQEKKEKKQDEDKDITLHVSNDIQRDFNRMINRFQRDFENFFGMPKRLGEFGAMLPWRAGMPSVDIEDRGKDFLLTVDMPGFKKEDIDIEVTNDYVVIQAAKRETKAEDRERNYIHKERISETYYRRIRLPQEVNSNDAQANLNDGILKITLPKKEPIEKKKLTII